MARTGKQSIGFANDWHRVDCFSQLGKQESCSLYMTDSYDRNKDDYNDMYSMSLYVANSPYKLFSPAKGIQ